MTPSITSFCRALAWLVASSSTVWSAELIMVDEPGCPWCARWEAEIGPIYPKTKEAKRAPIRRIDISDVANEIDLETRVVFTPTFLLVADDVELDRMEGYMGDEFFWVLLNQMLDRHLEEDNS